MNDKHLKVVMSSIIAVCYVIGMVSLETSILTTVLIWIDTPALLLTQLLYRGLRSKGFILCHLAITTALSLLVYALYYYMI